MGRPIFSLGPTNALSLTGVIGFNPLTLMQKTHQLPRLRISLQDSPPPVATESDSFAIYPFFQPINLVYLTTKQSAEERIETACD